ncbi:MAG: hypothetical protein AAF589_01255 [Planctomycetota bacterium]
MFDVLKLLDWAGERRRHARLIVPILFATGITLPAAAQLYIPPGGTAGGVAWPTTSWTRGDANTVYAEWDNFDSPEGPNAPDVGSFGFADPTEANVVETSEGATGAFITSGGNIYSFSAATFFGVDFPAVDIGVADVYVVAQLFTLGNEPSSSSFSLSFDGGQQGLAPTGNVESQRDSITGGFGGTLLTSQYYWELSDVDPTSFLLEFNSEASSMSLAGLVIDVFAVESIAIPGDYDGSGSVDINDFYHWQDTFGLAVGAGLPAAGDGADGNGDGVVDGSDYAWLRNNWPVAAATAAPALAVPEPGSIQTVSIAAISLLFCGWVTWFNRPPRF